VATSEEATLADRTHQIVDKPVTAHHHYIVLFYLYREHLGVLHRLIPRVGPQLHGKVELGSSVVLGELFRSSLQAQSDTTTHSMLHLLGPKHNLPLSNDNASAIPQIRNLEFVVLQDGQEGCRGPVDALGSDARHAPLVAALHDLYR
jgi:hypothetical protein